MAANNQNFKYPVPSQLSDFKEQLEILKRNLGGVPISSLGGMINGGPGNLSESFGLSNEDELALGKAHVDMSRLERHLASQVEQLQTVASLNYKAKNNVTAKVHLSTTEAESKRLVLAFESR